MAPRHVKSTKADSLGSVSLKFPSMLVSQTSYLVPSGCGYPSSTVKCNPQLSHAERAKMRSCQNARPTLLRVDVLARFLQRHIFFFFSFFLFWFLALLNIRLCSLTVSRFGAFGKTLQKLFLSHHLFGNSSCTRRACSVPRAGTPYIVAENLRIFDLI